VSSSLLLLDPEGRRACLSAGRGEVVTPQAGTMILFPSWLIHSVTRFRGTRPRISVAFNVAG